MLETIPLVLVSGKISALIPSSMISTQRDAARHCQCRSVARYCHDLKMARRKALCQPYPSSIARPPPSLPPRLPTARPGGLREKSLRTRRSACQCSARRIRYPPATVGVPSLPVLALAREPARPARGGDSGLGFGPAPPRLSVRPAGSEAVAEAQIPPGRDCRHCATASRTTDSDRHFAGAAQPFCVPARGAVGWKFSLTRG